MLVYALWRVLLRWKCDLLKNRVEYGRYFYCYVFSSTGKIRQITLYNNVRSFLIRNHITNFVEQWLISCGIRKASCFANLVNPACILYRQVIIISLISDRKVLNISYLYLILTISKLINCLSLDLMVGIWMKRLHYLEVFP